MGLSKVRDDHPIFFRPETIRISLWAVLGLWLARRLARLIMLIVRSPSAVAAIVLATAGLLGWHLVHPALPLGVLGGLVVGLIIWRVR